MYRELIVTILHCVIKYRDGLHNYEQIAEIDNRLNKITSLEDVIALLSLIETLHNQEPDNIISISEYMA